VENTRPTAPTAALEPAEPTAPRGVSVSIRRPSTDRDEDEITYRYVWYRDGVQTQYAQSVIPPAVLRNGETWRADITPFDGEEAGEVVSVSAVVKNTPPPPPSVVLAPPAPTTGEAVTCDAKAPERDADQERIELRYRWYRNDQPIAIGEASAELPPKVIRRGERWRCEAWSWDGTAESARSSAELTVRNSPPSAPAVAIEPAAPRRGDDLSCRVETASTDIDDDPVTYTYAWTRNGRPVSAGPDPARIYAAQVAKGERWRCTVTPSDGALAGAAAVAERSVLNTPPGPAIVRLQPAAPSSGNPIRCEILAKSEDSDGDAVRYRYAWERNGVSQPFAESSQEVPARLVKAGERWRCVVTSTDGAEDAPPAGSEDALVAPDEGGSQAPVRTVSGRPGDRPSR
jgi:hypothetical protein